MSGDRTERDEMIEENEQDKHEGLFHLYLFLQQNVNEALTA